MPYIYFAGSHQGCGCGFLKEGEVGEALEDCRRNYQALAEVLDGIAKLGGQAELFACWEGEQNKQPKFIDQLSVSQLLAPEFEFKDLHFIRVVISVEPKS